MGLNDKKNARFAVGALALLCLVLLFVGGPGPYALRTFRYAWGLGHLFCFSLWTFIYLQWRSGRPLLRTYAEALLLALVLGAVTELLQIGVAGREATWQDLGLDLLGSLLALVMGGELKSQLDRWRLWLVRIPVLLVVCWVLMPLARVVVDDLRAWSQFPLLAGFETRLELGRWGGDSTRTLSDQYVYSGSRALRCELNTNRYSGVALKYFPADWSQYRSVRFHLFNPQSEQIELLFRIHDQHHWDNDSRYSDRFNTRLVFQPGWTKQEISLAEVETAPRERKMDLARIAGLILFVGKLEQPLTFYLDEVQLVR